jgi:hypothetical protein
MIENTLQKVEQSAISQELQDYLERKKSEIKSALVSFRYDVGGILSEVKMKLKDTSSTSFYEWTASMGISRSLALRLIDYFKIVEKNQDSLKLLPQGLVLEFGKEDTPLELKQKVENGEIKTLKELKDIKKQYTKLKKEKDEILPELQSLEKENDFLKSEKGKLVKQINNLADVCAKKDLLIENSGKKNIGEFNAIMIDITAFVSSKIPVAKYYLSKIEKDEAKKEFVKAKDEINKILNLLGDIYG